MFSDKQLIRLQETPNEIPEGETPISVNIEIHGNHDNSLNTILQSQSRKNLIFFFEYDVFCFVDSDESMILKNRSGDRFLFIFIMYSYLFVFPILVYRTQILIIVIIIIFARIYSLYEVYDILVANSFDLYY